MRYTNPIWDDQEGEQTKSRFSTLLVASIASNDEIVPNQVHIEKQFCVGKQVDGEKVGGTCVDVEYVPRENKVHLY